MISVTKTPAQESASANAATSVPAPAGTTTSTTESRLSVGEFHALQHKKRMEDKDAAPRTVLEGSSVLNTYGSMSTDYGPDISDVPMEDEASSFSTSDYQSVVDTHDPVTESRQPREEDSNASRSKRLHIEAEDKPPTPVTPSSPSSVPTKRAPSVRLRHRT
ncbi:hypothetical protein PC116_g6901 [Phytophthora cactorum]|uniref:Uncharacterized protein n=2 Tax=Phytophthora cactorum TaxID=29920 RepID=A0A329T0W6_9STRA|nr:hypothetical protein Pcac1_g11313 [Phytophthora cactorum]KAG2839291.1 hypothetical protein PC112_g4160 [Phytophthora cactorum]KAG2841354.1 hypothetical protein PC111_g3104 [Phytophthora cactorum]KAG2865020.1 hypothetical protein PC113_g4057 [Phytophthora cactorum]KAG2875091.1 hypothetical protein PC115_g23994 [Phytophthora cactorum]